MKILLIDPPGVEGNSIGRILGSFGTNKADQAWPPYDLQIIGGYCLKQGFKFSILDANNLRLSWDKIYSFISSYNPDWVIYLTCFPTFLLDAQVASCAKRFNPKIKTACVSLSMYSVTEPEEKMQKIKDLDFIIWGEQEIPLMKLLQGEEPAKIEGLYYKEDDKISFTGKAPQLQNLDDFGVPVHYPLSIQIYKCPLALRRPMTIVSCSRGCINWCIHCQGGTFQQPLRYRSVNRVLEELNEVKSLGVKEIKFYDCSLPNNPEFAGELCQAMISNGYNFSWNCNARSEKLEPGLLKKMKASGCHTVCMGCESSDPRILNNMRKNETPEVIERAVRLVKEYKMRAFLYLTFGLPGETKETMQGTFDFVRRLKPDFVTFGIAVPAPGTPFYAMLKEKGLLIEKDLPWNDPNALPAFQYPDLSREELLSFTRSAYSRFYFNPVYIFRRMSNLSSFTEFYMYVTSAFAILRRYIFEPRK